MPGAAVAAHPGREGMPLSVVAFRNDAPLHGVAVERPAGVQGLGVAPTARAMVDDEVVAVGSAEAFGSELASVISRADAQKADDDVMRSRQFEGSAVALGFLDADAVTRRRLARNGQVGFADYQPPGFNQTANTKNHRARPFGFYRLSRLPGPESLGLVTNRTLPPRPPLA